MPSPVRKLSEPAKKLAKDVAKINTRLMDENMTLKQFVAEQAEYIRKLHQRKSKAHNRLKALRSLNKHVEFLQMQNSSLFAQNDALRQRLMFAPRVQAHRSENWITQLLGWGRGD